MDDEDRAPGETVETTGETVENIIGKSHRLHATIPTPSSEYAMHQLLATIILCWKVLKMVNKISIAKKMPICYVLYILAMDGPALFLFAGRAETDGVRCFD